MYEPAINDRAVCLHSQKRLVTDTRGHVCTWHDWAWTPSLTKSSIVPPGLENWLLLGLSKSELRSPKHVFYHWRCVVQGVMITGHRTSLSHLQNHPGSGNTRQFSLWHWETAHFIGSALELRVVNQFLSVLWFAFYLDLEETLARVEPMGIQQTAIPCEAQYKQSKAYHSTK